MADTTERFTTFILDSIREARKTRGYSGMEWLYPIRGLYVGLAQSEQEYFRREVIGLLDKPSEGDRLDCLIELVQLCQFLGVKESCSALIELAKNPPPKKEVGDFYAGGEALRADAWAALGELGCEAAIPLLMRQLEETRGEVQKLSDEDIKSESLAFKTVWSKGPALLALVKIDPDKARDHFGWWLSLERRAMYQGVLNPVFAMVKQIGHGVVGFVGICLQAILRKKGGLMALQGWLRELFLLDESDRQYLAESSELIMGSKDFWSGIEDAPKRDDARRLAVELSNLPKGA